MNEQQKQLIKHQLYHEFLDRCAAAKAAGETWVREDNELSDLGIAVVMLGMFGAYDTRDATWRLDEERRLVVRWTEALRGGRWVETGSVGFEVRGPGVRARQYLWAGFTPQEFVTKLERFISKYR